MCANGGKSLEDFDWLDFIKNHWVWLAPSVYIYLTVVGMVQSWHQFQAFRINVFEFSELTDFLIFAFRDPISIFALLLLIIYIVIVYGILYLSKRLRKIFAQRGMKVQEYSTSILISASRISFAVTSAVVIVGAPFFLPLLLNDNYSDNWKEGYLIDPDRKIEVIFKDLEKYGYKAEWIDGLVLIGTTNKYIFFFDESNKSVMAAPQSNILLIRRL